MIIAEIQASLEEAFSIETDMGIIRGVTEGIWLADELCSVTPFMNSDVGRDAKGWIRRAGVNHRLQELSETGEIPYKMRIVKMPHGRLHFLEIQSKMIRANVCRTDAVDAFPTESLSRQDSRLINQGDLFQDSQVIPLYGNPLYAYLTYGVIPGSKLGHLCWGIESKEGGDWLGFINILRRSSSTRSIATESPSPFTPPAKSKLRFKEEIMESLRKETEEPRKTDESE